MADNTTVVVINGKNIKVESGTILVLGAGSYAGAYRVKLDEASAAEISAAKTIDDNESDNVTETGEDADNDTNEKYRKGVNYLVNMIIENPSEFIKLSAACVGNMYPKFLNPAIAGLNARDCEKDAVYELAKFIGDELCNAVIDIVFSEIDTKTKSDILSFLVNAKMAMNDNNIEPIIFMIEKYLSVVTATVFTNNAK